VTRENRPSLTHRKAGIRQANKEEAVKNIVKLLFQDLRQSIATAVCALLLSASLSFVLPMWYRGGLWQYTNDGAGLATVIFQWLGLALGIFMALNLLIPAAPRFLRWLDRFEPLKAVPLSWDGRSVLVGAAVIFVFCIPWLVLMYPGNTAYDAVAQLYQIQGSGALRPEVYEGTPEGWVSDTHPVFHTLILWVFFKLGILFGSQNLGILLYCIFQAVLQSLCFSLACCYLNKMSVPKIVRLAALAFFALFPAIASSCTMVFKDYVFSPVYVVYLIGVIHIVRTRGACLNRRRNLVSFIVLCVLLAILKKTGVYVVLLVGLVLLLVYRRHIKALLLATGLPVAVIYVIFPFIVFPLFHVVPGSVQEVMGPFLQQTARVVYFHGDEIPKEERDIIDKMVPYAQLPSLYSQNVADPVKGNFHQKATRGEILAYLGVWASQFGRYPDLYFEATLGIVTPYIVPCEAWPIEFNLPPGTQKHYIEIVTVYERYRNNNVKYLENDLSFGSPIEMYDAKKQVYNAVYTLSYTPVAGIFLSMGYYVIWVPLLSFCALVRLRPRDALSFLPVLVSFVILMISPLAMARYALPMLDSAPLLLGLAIMACRSPEVPVVEFSRSLFSRKGGKTP
jgi:hypothetical protein